LRGLLHYKGAFETRNVRRMFGGGLRTRKGPPICIGGFVGQVTARANLGLDRKPCERCAHRRDMHTDRDGFTVCIVCDRSSAIWPCAQARLRDEAQA